MLQKKRLTRDQAYQKIIHYCSYQERSHAEVREKLYSFSLYKTEVETLISRLIEEDYLNEERFAKMFAGGKFRMKHWGKVQIKYELKQRRVSEYNIMKGLKEIPEEDYVSAFRKLFEAKLKALQSEKNVPARKRKILDYLLRKGYERDMIMGKLNEI
jgi:regulatory protein